MTATANLSPSVLADSVLVNYQNSTRRMSIAAFIELIGGGSGGSGPGLAAEIADRQAADRHGDIIFAQVVTEPAPTAQAMTAAVPAAQAHIALAVAQHLQFRWAVTNTGADPTIRIDGVTYTIRARNGGALAAGDLVGGQRYQGYVFQADPGIIRLRESVRISDINGLAAELADIVANGGKFYASRAAAVAAGQDAMPPALSRIVTIEANDIVYRGPGQTTEDPLFAAYPNWGVITRTPRKDYVDTQDTLRSTAIRDSGILPLTNVAGTGDAITADLAASMVAAGITVLSGVSEIEYIPGQTNSLANPTFLLGGVNFGIRDADGGAWPAFGFKVGRSYKLRRRGSALRVTGDTSSIDMATERLDRIAVESQAGTYSLENIGGTGNVITASLPSILTARGISAANIRGIRFVAGANNDGAVSINIDGVGPVDLRSPTGVALAANRIQLGRIYTAAKVGSRWHLVSGEVTAGDLTVERNATIANFGAAGWLRLVSVGGTPDAITAEIAGGGADLGANTNGNYVMIRPTATNATSAPTLQIAGGPVRTLFSETNGPLGAGRLVPNTWNVILLASNGNAQVQGIFVKPSELPAIRETLTTTTALANTLNSTVAAIAAKSVLEYALQTGNTLPVRPNAPVVHWLCWTDPAAVMGPADMWFELPSPTVPDMPAEASWRWQNARTGNTAMLQILSVPAASPPITAVQYRLDGGAWVSVPAVAGEVIVPGLTLGQAYAMDIRYVNFVGPGVPTATRSITVSDAGFVDNFNRADQPLSNDARWVSVVFGLVGRQAVIYANAVRPAATNETYVVQVQEYFAPDQAAEALILGAGVNTASGRGAMLFVRMPTGEYSGYRLRIAGNTWVLSRIVNGVTTTLASGTHANVYPVQARLVAQGSVITAYLGGAIVATVTDTSPAAFTRGTVGLGVEAAGADGAGSVRIDNFTAGNV